MEWSKIKNIIILLLVITNLFLLVAVLSFRHNQRSSEEATLEAVRTVLADRGIEISDDALPPVMELTALAVPRDTQAEAALAQALLGECMVTDQGGGLYVYTGQGGSAHFRSAGELTITLSANDFTAAGGEIQDHAQETLERMGVEASILTTVTEGNTSTVTARQSMNGAPLFNCEIRLQYNGSQLLVISGRLLTGTPQADAAAGDNLPMSTALMRFLSAVTESGDVCRSITTMTAGYLHSTSFTDPVRLSPVWFITTDTASYYLDAATGDLTRLT